MCDVHLLGTRMRFRVCLNLGLTYESDVVVGRGGCMLREQGGVPLVRKVLANRVLHFT